MEKDNTQQEIQGSFLHVHFASLMNHIHHSVSGEDEKFQETCEKRRGVSGRRTAAVEHGDKSRDIYRKFPSCSWINQKDFCFQRP